MFYSLPKAVFHLSMGGALFFYHMGAYYKKGINGYIVVNAPIGAVINTLPPNYSTVVVNGVTYLVYGGIYYLPHRNGFIVVADPTKGDGAATIDVPAATIIPNQVRTTPRRLNVRSAPNRNSTIIRQLPRGTIVKVTGTVAGWYKVRMTHGSTGWVMIKFTTPLLPADG